MTSNDVCDLFNLNGITDPVVYFYFRHKQGIISSQRMRHSSVGTSVKNKYITVIEGQEVES